MIDYDLIVITMMIKCLNLVIPKPLTLREEEKNHDDDDDDDAV